MWGTAEAFRRGGQQFWFFFSHAAAYTNNPPCGAMRGFGACQMAVAYEAAIDKLASAKSITEAFQIQSDLVRAHGETLVARAKSTSEYVGKLVTEGAKSAQENFSKVAASYNKAA